MLTFLPYIQEYDAYTTPHPIKARAAGRSVFLAPLLLYTDDTSGNRSKKWNKFDQWCFLLAGLPRHENMQLRNIHFITCSNQVSLLDMAKPIVSDLVRLEEGVPLYDVYLQKEVLVIAPILAVLADNPRHAELLNHAGGAANKYCRMCLVRTIGAMSWCSIVYCYEYLLGWQTWRPNSCSSEEDHAVGKVSDGRHWWTTQWVSESSSQDRVWDEGDQQPNVFTFCRPFQVSPTLGLGKVHDIIVL